MIGNRNGADPVDVDTTNSPTNSPYLAFRASQSVGMTFSGLLPSRRKTLGTKLP